MAENEKEDFKEASIIDRIYIELNEEQEHQLSNWITKKKEAIAEDRSDFLERQKRYLLDFDDFITPTRKGPWDGSSNLKMPLTAIMLKSYHARLYNIFTQEDAANYSPREQMDERKVSMLKRLRDWYIWDHINGYKGIKGVADEMFYDVASVGWSVVMKSWELKQRKIIDIINQQELKKEMTDLSPQADQAIAEGNQIQVKPYKEVQKVITVFEGSRLQTLPFENVYFQNEIPESSDLDYPDMVLVVSKMTTSELRLKVKQGIYSSEKIDKVVNETKSKTSSSNPRETNIKEIRDRLTGFESLNSYNDISEIDIEYAFCRYDIDDDGLSEEIVVTRSGKGTIIHVQYLDRISPNGFRPLIKFDCFTKPRQAYSRGVPEQVHTLQEEMDINHNMRMDYLQLQTCPFMTYRAGSSLQNQDIRIAPGKAIGLDDVNDLKPFTFNSNAHVYSLEEDRDWKYAEWMLSVGPISHGSVPTQVGPTRSTSGVIALLQQMDKEFKPVVDRIATQWKRLEMSLLEDLDFRVDPDVKIRVLGPDVKGAIQMVSAEDIMKFHDSLMLTRVMDLKIDVASVINSDEVKRNEATLILQTLINPSLLQQSGIVGSKGMLKGIIDYLKAYGKNPDQYIDEPEFIQKALTLFQEVQICGQGEMPPMSMQDNHDEKAQMLQQFLQESSFLEAKQKGLYDPNVDLIIMKAAQKHAQLAQALKPVGMANPTGAQNQDINQLLSGSAPQQGGSNVKNTTSRDLAQGKKPEGEQDGEAEAG